MLPTPSSFTGDPLADLEVRAAGRLMAYAEVIALRSRDGGCAFDKQPAVRVRLIMATAA
jgi:hypothetical protein